MARKGIKRASSMAKRSGSVVAKKCKTIANTVRAAEDVPKPVRSMLCDTLVRTFGTYKEERHAFQNSASALVGTILKKTQGNLQSTIQDAQQKKSAVDTEAAKSSAANDAAVAASEATAQALANSKTNVADSKTALKDAKTHLHDLEVTTKTAETDAVAATTKKEKLEVLANDFIPTIKAGTTHGAKAGNHVSKDVASSVDAEFLTCVTRTFSKPVATWGTFDNIVDERLGGFIKKAIGTLTTDLATMATAQDSRAASVEAAKAAITTSEERVKAMEEACTAAAAAAKEAEGAAKAATAAFKAQQAIGEKAAGVCKHAEDALAAFEKGALAAYTEVEARTAPPPEPVAEPAPAAAAMAPAPAAAAPASILRSPQVLYQQARSLLTSPRTVEAQQAQSPRQQQAPSY